MKEGLSQVLLKLNQTFAKDEKQAKFVIGNVF